MYKMIPRFVLTVAHNLKRDKAAKLQAVSPSVITVLFCSFATLPNNTVVNFT